MITGVGEVDLEISRTGNNVFEITDAGSTSFTGATVKFVAKWHERDSATIISLTSPVGITVATSLITITVAPSDILNTLPYEDVKVKYEVTVNGVLGLRGNLIIRPNVIR
jgi:hypothetical protein